MSEHIKIIKPGALSTLQDAGRSGFSSIGISPGGVMDQYAFQIANRLLGNDPKAPVIEMHFPAPVIEFNSSVCISVCGADFTAKLNDTYIEPWSKIRVSSGDILLFERIQKGFRCYLAIEGGFKGEEWLGSYSTNLTLKMGGHNGRMLQKSDLIPINNFKNERVIASENIITAEELESIYNEKDILSCMPGPEWELLSSETQQKLLTGKFTVSVNSNRMACLLKDEKNMIDFPSTEMLSSAVMTGTVQLMPNGSLAILMADHQTTGGFPRILQVLQSQLPKLAQALPGVKIQFRMIDPASAEADYLAFMKKCLHA